MYFICLLAQNTLSCHSLFEIVVKSSFFTIPRWKLNALLTNSNCYSLLTVVKYDAYSKSKTCLLIIKYSSVRAKLFEWSYWFCARKLRRRTKAKVRQFCQISQMSLNIQDEEQVTGTVADQKLGCRKFWPRWERN